MGIRKYSIAQIIRKVAVAIQDPKVFIDMDGVLTNWSKAVKDLGSGPAAGLSDDATQEQKQMMYDAIEKAGADFWAEMKWLDEGKELWDLVKGLNPVLLSSPGKFRFAPAGKRIWVQENLPGISLFLDENKYQYAESVGDTILIDDNKENISSWIESGGIGILHEDLEKTKTELQRVLRGEQLKDQEKNH
jgi:hypothetical protein